MTDGNTATIGGVVSAVFGDCCYIEEADRSRGIKVIGMPGCHEGDTVSVSGTVGTFAGERIFIAQP